MAAGKVVKEEGKANDLLERIAADPAFGMNMEQLQAIMNPENFVGCLLYTSSRILSYY